MARTGLDTRLEFVLGGPSAKKVTEQLQLRTVGELLAHYPRRYVERGVLSDLGSLRVDEHVTVQAGGQAIVGNVSHGPGGGSPLKKEETTS